MFAVDEREALERGQRAGMPLLEALHGTDAELLRTLRRILEQHTEDPRGAALTYAAFCERIGRACMIIAAERPS